MFTELHDCDLKELVRSPSAHLLLSIWDLLRRDQAAPAPHVLEMHRIVGTMRDDLMILDRVGSDDLIYRHYGARIAAHSGFDMTGLAVSSFQGAMGAFFRAVYRRAIHECRPLLTLHRMGHYRERPLWERVVLPTLDNGVVRTLIVMNQTREIAEDFAQLRGRAPGNALLILQFQRADDGAITDILIAGANDPARRMLGLRPDELIDRPLRSALPAIASADLLAKIHAVECTRRPRQVMLDQSVGRSRGRFDLLISPIADGVSLDLAALAVEPAAL